MNPEKLAKLQAQLRESDVSAHRRSVKKVTKTSASAESSKLAGILKKVGTKPLSNVDEVNMFRSDGKVQHFVSPKVQGDVASNVFVITGANKDKELTELAPGILAQLGPSAMANLQEMARKYQAQAAAAGMSLEELAKLAASSQGMDESEIPDLVKNFESAEIDAN